MKNLFRLCVVFLLLVTVALLAWIRIGMHDAERRFYKQMNAFRSEG